MSDKRDKNGKFTKGSKINQGRIPSEEQKRKQAEKMRGRVESDEHKAKIKAGMLASMKVIGRPKGGIPWNKGMKRIKGDPIPVYTYTFTDEGRKRRSAAKKKEWADFSPEKKSEKIKQMLRISSPNKSELYLGDILEEMYPGEWRFVGNGQIIINGKCPDFININGQKKIIEFYGENWHRGDDPEARKNVFRPFGYETLIVWGRDLKNIDKLKITINNFCNTV